MLNASKFVAEVKSHLGKSETIFRKIQNISDVSEMKIHRSNCEDSNFIEALKTK